MWKDEFKDDGDLSAATDRLMADILVCNCPSAASK